MSVTRALAFSYVDKYASLAINVAASLVLARLLTPRELGVYSVTAVMISIAGALRDFGAGTYVVQEKSLDSGKIRAASAVALTVGAGFATLLYLFSAAIARFYGEPGVEQVMHVLAMNFLIVPFGSVVQWLLARDMRFDAIAIVNVCYATVHATVAVGLAWAGHGYMSLAWAALAASFVSALVTNLFRPDGTPWVPSLKGIRSVLSFGGKASALSVVEQVTTGLPDLIVGRIQGFEIAGLYGRADSFVSLYRSAVMRALWPVVLPYFSQRKRDGDDVPAHYLRATMLITAVGWPFLLFMSLMAEPLIMVLYGPQWTAAVGAARLLCVASALGVVLAFAGQVMVAIGRLDALLKIHVALLPVKFAVVTAGAFHGLEGLALAMLFWSLFAVVLYSRMIMRALGLRLQDFTPIVLKSGALVAATTGATLAGIAVFGWRPNQPIVALIVTLALASVAYLAVAFAIRHPICDWIVAARDRVKRPAAG